MDKNNRYHLTVPIPIPLNEKYWDIYLEYLMGMKADRVLFFAPMDNICRMISELEDDQGIKITTMIQQTNDVPQPDIFRSWTEMLGKKIDLFKRKGIEVGFWMGHTIGHGGELSAGHDMPFQQITGPEGNEAPGCFCPLDKNFENYICEVVSVIAHSEVALILLDDDFRMNWHGNEATVGCFCKKHLEAFREKTGLALSGSEIAEKVFSGKPGEIRKAWLEITSETLMNFASKIERAIHSVNPKVRIGLATAMTLWSSEGIDMRKLLKQLSGETRGFLRTIGAPYWSREPFHASWIIELSRLQKSWMKGAAAEVIAEGDTYPHTRYFTSAAMLHAFQQGLYASGFCRVLNYAFVYSPPPQHELGYFEKSAASVMNYKAICGFFPGDYEDFGVSAIYKPNILESMELPEAYEGIKNPWPDEPIVLQYLSRLGVPLAYGQNKGPVILPGIVTDALRDSEIEEFMDRGVIMDATAAKKLTDRGFDVGIVSVASGEKPKFEVFSDAGFSGRFHNEYIWLLAGGSGIFYRCEIKDDTAVISRFEGNRPEESYPAVMLYENKKGQRSCIISIDFHSARRGMQLMYNYARQEQLTRCISWVNRKPLAVTVNGYPDVHVIGRISKDEDKIVIAIQNAHLDPVIDPVLRLSPEVDIRDRIEILLPDAEERQSITEYTFSRDKEYGYLKLKCMIPPMKMIGLELQMKGL